MLNEYGYNRPTYQEILQSKIQKAKELFGEDIDTSETTALGKFIRIGAYDLSKAYEDIEGVYYSHFPSTASGVSLDRLAVLAGISRHPASYATRTITVYGDSGTEVTEIKVCGENDEIIFHNTQTFVIPESGNIDILVECETAGTIGNIYKIDNIVNPIAGVESVSYKGSENDFNGSDTESDYELRNRWSQSIVGRGASNTNSIIAAILNVPTVKAVSIIENNENKEVDGRPAHTFECYVYGGDNYYDKIAQAIYDKKPIGIQSFGSITIDIIDAGGTPHPIKFSKTVAVPVYISIKYKKNSKFEDNGEQQIKDALTQYINNLGVGTSLNLSSLYGYVFNVEGVRDVTELIIGIDAENLTTNNIEVEQWECAVTDETKITLTEVS